MERGLLWLPLLAIFIWLAWAGRNEFQKVEAYRNWAQGFDRSKYDVLSVLGLKDGALIWGRPTRQGPMPLTKLPLAEVEQVRVQVNGDVVDPNNPPSRVRRCGLVLAVKTGEKSEIPFTDLKLALEWYAYLIKEAPQWQ